MTHPHIFKSSPASREWWLRFTLRLQNKTITDHTGTPINKRDVFDSLYVESDRSDFNQSELLLVMAGLHPLFGLIPRTDYNRVAIRNQQLKDATEETLKSIAVRIARNLGTTGDFSANIGLMVKGMTEVYENYHKIDEEINSKVD